MYYASLIEDHHFAKEIRLNALGKWLLDRERNYFTKVNDNQKKQNDGFIISGFLGAIFTLVQQSAAYAYLIYCVVSGTNGIDTSVFKNFVLDEPTAALDPKAEYELYQKFNEMVQGKTAVYISHRQSSAKFCDVIAVFSNGQIIEYGSHDELYSKGGLYAELFSIKSQFYC